MKRPAKIDEINRAFEARRKAIGRAMTLEEIQALDADLAQEIERDDAPPAGYLQVGLSPDCREVIVNHPDLQPDANGVGHLVFSPDQARTFAHLLLAKADKCAP